MFRRFFSEAVNRRHDSKYHLAGHHFVKDLLEQHVDLQAKNVSLNATWYYFRISNQVGNNHANTPAQRNMKIIRNSPPLDPPVNGGREEDGFYFLRNVARVGFLIRKFHNIK